MCECFTLTVEAFNLAERYRTPVIVLSDAMVGHMREGVALPAPEEMEIVERRAPDCTPEEYRTLVSSVDHIVPRPPLGSKFTFRVTGLVYDRQSGRPDTSTPEVAQELGVYLREKIYRHREEIAMVEELEMEDAEVALFAYGSVARSAKAAMRWAREQGVRVGLVRPITLWPFPTAAIERTGSAGTDRHRARDEPATDELGGPGGGARQGRGDRLRTHRRPAHHPGGDPGADQAPVPLPPLGGRA